MFCKTKMKNKKTKKLIVFAIVVCALLLTQISTALGTAQITLTVKNPNPYEGNYSWFVYTEEAGRTIKDIATIKNFSSEPTDVEIYAVDAKSSETGSFILSFLEDQQKGIGAWTTVESKSLTIPPFEVQDIPFEINIPADAPPGQYLGGIVIENGKSATSSGITEPDESGTSIAVKTRIGSRVYLTIPGEIKEDLKFNNLKVKEALAGNTKFELTLVNNGNISYEPKATVEIYNQRGELYETIEKELGTIAPNTKINPIVEMKKRPIIGNFTAKANVVFHCKFTPENLHGSAHNLTNQTTFLVLPWEIILTILFIIFTGLGIFANHRIAKKRYIRNGEKYQVKKHEDLVAIGNARDISWKKIAKYNGLKAPYIVKPGDIIIVPKNKKTDNK